MRKAERIVHMILDEYDVTPKEEAVRTAETARTWLKPSGS
jgi:hypothetical protein